MGDNHMFDGGWHWGFGFGHWSLGILFWLVIILAIYGAIKLLSGSSKD
jgi:hypothetical protein